MNTINEVPVSPSDETRRAWGKVFRDLWLARERWDGAWYSVADKQAWIDEEEHRLCGIEKEVEKARRALQERSAQLKLLAEVPHVS